MCLCFIESTNVWKRTIFTLKFKKKSNQSYLDDRIFQPWMRYALYECLLLLHFVNVLLLTISGTMLSRMYRVGVKREPTNPGSPGRMAIKLVGWVTHW